VEEKLLMENINAKVAPIFFLPFADLFALFALKAFDNGKSLNRKVR